MRQSIWKLRKLLSDKQARSIYSVDTLDKGMSHIPGRTEWDSKRFHHTAHNGMQFKTCELFIFGIFHLIFSDYSWPWVTETIESETMDKRLLLLLLSCFSHIQLCVTLWTAACQAPQSIGFSRQEYWSGLPCPPPGDLPDSGIEPTSPVSYSFRLLRLLHWQVGSLPLAPPGKACS